MKDQLIKLGVTAKRAADIEPILLELINTYQLPKEALPEFISNVLHESGYFTIKAENLHYTTPARLVAIWPSRFTTTKEPNKRDANLFIKNPRALANLVYGGRMGNVHTNDGFDFRGGGFAQITGRDAYLLFTRFVNQRDLTKRTITEVAELVQTNDTWAMDSALWFFCEFKNLEQMAIQDKFKDLVKRWNGGYIGMQERLELYDKAQTLFS